MGNVGAAVIGAVLAFMLGACGGGDDDDDDDVGGTADARPSSTDATSPDAMNPCLETGSVPPKITQVYVRERVMVDTNGDGTPDAERTRSQLAFGDDARIAAEDDDREVVAAISKYNQIWIVFDRELDLQPTLPSGVVTILCDGVEAEIHFSGTLASRYYNAAGELIPDSGSPTGDGVTTLGPAISLSSEILRTGAVCTIPLGGIMTADGTCACAPAGGNPVNTCTPGDLSKISFGTKGLYMLGSNPVNGATNFPVDQWLLFQFSADLDPSSLDVSLTASGSDVAKAARLETDPAVVSLTPDQPLLPDTSYAVRFAGGVGGLTDLHGGPLLDDVSVSFTTAP